MKLVLCALLLAAASAVEVEEDCDCNDPKAMLERALGQKEGLMKRWGDACVKERAETKDWMNSVDPKVRLRHYGRDAHRSQVRSRVR